MHAVNTMGAGRMLPALTRIDLSSWLSWSCWTAGFALALSPEMAADLQAFGPGAKLLLASIVAFFAIAVAIQRHMRIKLSAASFGAPARLVTSGVFAYSRNPIYVAFLLPLMALGYFSLAAAAGAIALYLVSMTYLVIKAEERCLSRSFGDDYTAYAHAFHAGCSPD